MNAGPIVWSFAVAVSDGLFGLDDLARLGLVVTVVLAAGAVVFAVSALDLATFFVTVLAAEGFDATSGTDLVEVVGFCTGLDGVRRTAWSLMITGSPGGICSVSCVGTPTSSPGTQSAPARP